MKYKTKKALLSIMIKIRNHETSINNRKLKKIIKVGAGLRARPFTISFSKNPKINKKFLPGGPGGWFLAFPGRANTRFAPTTARESALNAGANLCVRPKILQYFFILLVIWP